MSETKASKKTSPFFPVFVISIFVLAILFFVIAISLEFSHGKQNIQSQFSSVLESTKKCLAQNGINDKFIDAFSNEIDKVPNLAAIILTKDSQPFFAYPASSQLFNVNENGEPEMNGNSPSLRIFTSSIEIENSTVVVSAAFYTISPNKIFFYAQITFIIILVSTILVFAVLISFYFKYRNVKAEDSEEAEVQNEQADSNSEITSDEISASEVQIDSSDLVEVDTETEDDSEEPVIVSIEPDAEVENNDFTSVETTKEEAEEEKASTKLMSSDDFEEKLNEELTRCASIEKDLALFFIQTRELSISDEQSKFILQTIINNTDSMIFGYGENSYAIISPEKNLDDAMEFVQNLYTNLDKTIKDNNLDTKFAIGIATRSLRIVPAERLIKEAQLALEKAFQQENAVPVVAFRVDLAKYKQSLMENS